jgi:hypothetical protein
MRLRRVVELIRQEWGIEKKGSETSLKSKLLDVFRRRSSDELEIGNASKTTGKENQVRSTPSKSENHDASEVAGEENEGGSSTDTESNNYDATERLDADSSNIIFQENARHAKLMLDTLEKYM